MKTLLISIAIILSFNILQAQEKNYQAPMLGDQAPKFTAMSTSGKINFPDDYFAKWKIILSHPAAFTPVCTSELLELAYLQDDFNKLNTQLLVLSTDGINSNIQWVESMETIGYKNNLRVKIKFPLISDTGLEISRAYGMIHPNSNSTKNIRAVYIIDPDDKISAILYYPNNIGRNMNEIKRTLEALQEVYKKDVLAPANWEQGKDLMLKSPETKEDADKLQRKNNPDLYSFAWYMWFKKK